MNDLSIVLFVKSTSSCKLVDDHVKYNNLSQQIVTTIDSEDEELERGKAAGIKAVRRMSMARLHRKFSEDPVSTYSARLFNKILHKIHTLFLNLEKQKSLR